MSQEQAPPTVPSALPFAVGSQHLVEDGRSRWRNTAAVLVIGGMMALALSGLLGGGPSKTVHASAPGLRADLTYDPIVRSGNWFEMTVDVRPDRAVKDLTVAIDNDVWRRMSIDTVAPDAESAEALDGQYSYHFGKVDAGQPFRLKLDGQIQAGMLRIQRGQVEVRDDDRKLLAIPVRLTVLP